MSPSVLPVIRRELAHIERRAAITEVAQYIAADRRGRRPPKLELAGRKK